MKIAINGKHGEKLADALNGDRSDDGILKTVKWEISGKSA